MKGHGLHGYRSTDLKVYRATRLQVTGLRVTIYGLQGTIYRVTGLQGHRVTGFWGYGSQGDRVTGLQVTGYKSDIFRVAVFRVTGLHGYRVTQVTLLPSARWYTPPPEPLPKSVSVCPPLS